MFDTQRWRASPVWLLYNLRAIQFNVHAVQLLVQLTKALNGRGLAKAGVVTQNFSTRSARTLLKEPPFLNS